MQKPIKKPAAAAGKISKRSDSTAANRQFNRKLAAELEEFRRRLKYGPKPVYYEPDSAIQEVVDAAVANAERRRRYREVMYFTFRGRRYSYSVTNIGRVWVWDSFGEKVGASRFGATWGD